MWTRKRSPAAPACALRALIAFAVLHVLAEVTCFVDNNCTLLR